MNRHTLLAAVLDFANLPALSQTMRTVSLDDLAKLRAVSDPHVSRLRDLDDELGRDAPGANDAGPRERSGAGGWSYGGILTDALIATDTRFAAAWSFAGSARPRERYYPRQPRS